jgi:hypothetical protein
MCMSLGGAQAKQIQGRGQPQLPDDPKDVPLGSGLAGNAKNSILERRERIRQAVEG